MEVKRSKPYYENRTIRAMVIYLSGRSWRTYQRFCFEQRNKSPYSPENIMKYLYSHPLVKKRYRPKGFVQLREIISEEKIEKPEFLRKFIQVKIPEARDDEFEHEELSELIENTNAN